MQIFRTTNYDMFKISERNRLLDRNNLKRIKESISERNLLHINPIIIDTDHVVIDGQHRLQACRELGVHVCYTIADEHEDAVGAIQQLNSAQKGWKIDDYLRYYKELPNTQFLMKMEREYGMRAATLFRLFATEASGEHKKPMNQVFKLGLRLNSSQETMEEYCIYVGKMTERMFISNIKKKIFFNIPFNRALGHYWSHPDVDREHLQDRVVQYCTSLPRSRTSEDMREYLSEVYNKNLKKKRLSVSSHFYIKIKPQPEENHDDE